MQVQATPHDDLYNSFHCYFLHPAIDVARSDSADEASEWVVIAVSDSKPLSSSPYKATSPPSKLDRSADADMDHSATGHTLSAQVALAMETKDIARLKQTVADLERRLKSRLVLSHSLPTGSQSRNYDGSQCTVINPSRQQQMLIYLWTHVYDSSGVWGLESQNYQYEVKISIWLAM
mgnify:CR=1 FL=1